MPASSAIRGNLGLVELNRAGMDATLKAYRSDAQGDELAYEELTSFACQRLRTEPRPGAR